MDTQVSHVVTSEFPRAARSFLWGGVRCAQASTHTTGVCLCVCVGGGGEGALKPTQTSHRLFSYCNSPYRVKFKFIDQTPWDITFILVFFLIQNTQNPLFIHVLYVYDIYKEIFCLQLNGVQWWNSYRNSMSSPNREPCRDELTLIKQKKRNSQNAY